MIAMLKEVVIPKLKVAGFSGSFPHLRRQREATIDLLTFQFSRWGGSFVVEVASCPAAGVPCARFAASDRSPSTMTGTSLAGGVGGVPRRSP